MNREPEQKTGSGWRQDGPESETLRLLGQPRPGLETRLLARLSADGMAQAGQTGRHGWRMGRSGWLGQRLALGTGFAVLGTALLAVLVSVRPAGPVARHLVGGSGAAQRGAAGQSSGRQADTGIAVPAAGARDAGSFGTAGSMRVPTTPPSVKPLHVPPPPHRRPGRRVVALKKKTVASQSAAGSADGSQKTQ